MTSAVATRTQVLRRPADVVRPAAVLAFGGVLAAIAADNGAYFPSSWGWSALFFAWLLVLALVLSRSVSLERLDWIWIGATAGFVGWVWLSSVWTASVWRPVQEGERSLVLLTAVAAALVLVRRASVPLFLGSVLAAVAGICVYALATRLFPDRVGVFDSIAGYRLSEPIGYWNSLGLFAAMGALLAVGHATDARRRLVHAGAGISLLVVVPTLYFTFSRGSWIALGVGGVILVAASARRFRLVCTMLALLPLPAVAVLVASRSEALTDSSTSVIAAAAHDGHRVALLLVLLAIPQALLAVGVALAAERFEFPGGLRVAFGASVCALAAGGLIGLFAWQGDPVTLAQRGYDAFSAPPPSTGTNLNERLFNFSGSGRMMLWRVAAHEFERHPWIGAGAGTFEEAWLADRPQATTVRNAHSLYLETLADLGVIGLALLVAMLAVPFVAFARAYGRPLVAGALAAYGAFLVHAAVDWDWQIPAVTLTALFAGAAIVVSARGSVEASSPLPSATRWCVAAAAVAVSALALVGLVGNTALGRSQDDAEAGRWSASAGEARRAASWAPWSAEPWRVLGEAQLAQRQLAAARGSLERALAKDDRSWLTWFDLAAAERGPAVRRDLAEARRLNPLSSEIAQYAATEGSR
jgi:O-antigen ligase